jgi:hypothetical protein
MPGHPQRRGAPTQDQEGPHRQKQEQGQGGGDPQESAAHVLDRLSVHARYTNRFDGFV